MVSRNRDGLADVLFGVTVMFANAENRLLRKAD